MVCRSGSCGLLARLLVGTAVACSIALPFRSRARRLEWQREAREDAPQSSCADGRHIQKELVLKPSRRTVVYLELEARETSEAGLQRRLEGTPVDALNAAVGLHRREPRATAELRLALLPVARELAGQVETWLAREVEARRDVYVRAHLAGGKAQWTYTPWRCVRGSWRKGRCWRVTVGDERDAPVAVLSHPYPVAVSAEVVLAQLTHFVAEVDVTAPQQPPGTVPVPHG
jgi:hypothetical protein